MTNRERWIVYPLLFYALVMGFRATYQDPLEFRCRTIECQQLKVQLINGAPALATATRFGGPNVIVVEAEPELVSRTKFPAGSTAPDRLDPERADEGVTDASGPGVPPDEAPATSEAGAAIDADVESEADGSDEALTQPEPLSAGDDDAAAP